MEQLSCVEKIRLSENPPQCGTNPKEAKSSEMIFEENRTGLPADRHNDGRPEKSETFFWSIEGNYIYRHHVEPRVQLYVPKEETFPTPMRYIDVVGRTRPLDVLQQSRMDDQWNIDGNRNLSEPWTGFTQFTKTNEKHPD